MRRVLVELVGVRALQGELVQALGELAADADGRQDSAGRPACRGRRPAWDAVRWMTSSDVRPRWLRGFRRMKMRPVLPVALGPPAPDAGHEVVDVRVLRRRSRPAACWCAIMASNEMPCAASVKHEDRARCPRWAGSPWGSRRTGSRCQRPAATQTPSWWPRGGAAPLQRPVVEPRACRRRTCSESR